MRRSQHLDSLGHLAGGMAHEFNNILMGIIGGTSLLIRHLPEGSKDLRNVQVMAESAERAANLTNQLLAFARGGKYQPVPLDLSETVNETISLLRPTIKRTAIIQMELDQNLKPVSADRSQIAQVLINLIHNANEAMNEKGQIFLKTRPASQEEIAGVLKNRYQRCNVLQVFDSGPGVLPEMRNKVFEPFFTTKEFGRGMGLAAVYGIIENHHGLIVCESTPPGEGALFTIYLPTLE